MLSNTLKSIDSVSDRSMLLWLTAALSIIATLVWLGLRTGDLTFTEGHPKPVWQDGKRMQAQLSDGRMVSLKVSLEVDTARTARELDRLTPAITGLIQRACQAHTRRSLAAQNGINRLGDEITDAVNDYLGEHHVEGEVKHLAFDEFIVLPEGEVNSVN